MNIGLMWKPACRPPLSRVAQSNRGMRRRLLSFLSSRAFALPLALGFSLLVVTATAANLKTVQVRDAEGSRYFYTFRANPISILKQHGIQLAADDRYDFTPYSHNKALIDLHMAFPVMVTVGKATGQTIMIAKGTVADALSKANVSVGPDDLVNYPLTQNVSSDMNVVVQRVTYKTVVKTQPISHQIDTQTTANLKKGTQQLASQGSDGEVATTVRQRYVDDELKSEEVVNQAVTVQPVNGVMLVGTAVDPPASQAKSSTAKSAGSTGSKKSGAPTNYSQVITTVATGYSPADGTATATGRKAAVGCVAVDPNVIPLGSRLYIQSTDGSFVYGYAVAADTGGFSHNGSGVGVDLFFDTAQQASNFGRKHVKVYVLD